MPDKRTEAFPCVGPKVPRRRYGFVEVVGRLILGTLGWRVEGAIPDVPRLVAVFAPHSSNWDFVITISVMVALRLRANFVAKHTLFRGPLGAFIHWLGGIPVDRKRPEGFVDAMIGEFAKQEQLWLTLAPEGTRTPRGSYKSGFYRIAQQAGVPILPVFLNYKAKVLGFLPPVYPNTLLEDGVAAIRDLLAGHGARRSGKP